jgi:diphthamide biosynthesis methyltransferase
MLTFIGLGLWDERSITLEGRDALRAADAVFAEFYTSKLVGTTLADLEAFHDIDIEVRDRVGVEQDPEPILAAAAEGDAAFLTAGDTMISTTHVDRRGRRRLALGPPELPFREGHDPAVPLRSRRRWRPPVGL